MKQQLLKLATIGVSALALTACSSMHGNNAGEKAYDNGAKTYSEQPTTTFKTAANGMRVNPLTAPADQSYYFPFASTAMRPQDLNALNIQAAYLVAHPNAKIRLDGNTDDRGSREYNIGLGWRRDQAVARFLKQQGVKPSQIQMVSYGKERPIALGDNPHSWTLNRRVDLVYKAG